MLEKAAAELGRDRARRGRAARPAMRIKLKPVRIGLWDQYGGSMTSGWMRWIFEQFEFPFEVVYPAALDAGQSGQPLRCAGVSRTARCRAPARGGRGGGVAVSVSPKPEDIPEEYRNHLGRVTAEKTIPQLRSSWKPAAPS